MKIIKSGISEPEMHRRECRCGCEFEFTKNDILSDEDFNQREWIMYWYVCCPECNDGTGFIEPKNNE